jgi:hypothetical protein
MRVACVANPVFCDFNSITVSGKQYKLWSYLSRNFLHSPALALYPLIQNCLLSAFFFIYVQPLEWETKFHTHTEQVKLNWPFAKLHESTKLTFEKIKKMKWKQT